MDGMLINLIIAIISSMAAFVCGFAGVLDEDEKIIRTGVISSIVFVLSIGMLIFGCIKLEKQPWDIPDKPFKTVSIVALNDNNMTSGRFYLRRGYFSEDLYYQYMKRSGSGFKAGKVKADKTTLYYDKNKNYRVECYEKTKKWLYFEESAYYYKIYIPEGSIAEDYIVDLE